MADVTSVEPANPRAETTPPDISHWCEGNVGVPYLWTFSGRRPGLHLTLTAILHGNESCGAIAISRLLEAGLRPRRGRITVIFANVDAYERTERSRPAPVRFVDEDMNRVWSPDALDEPRDTVELRRARRIRPFLDTTDILLDLHSMQHGTEPLLLCGARTKGLDLAREIGFPATIVADRGHVTGVRLRDYGDFDDPSSPKAALLVECGQHRSPISTAVAIGTALLFLRRFGAVSDRMLAEHLPPRPFAPQRLIEVTDTVTAETDRFRFAKPYAGLEAIATGGTVIARDGGRPITTPYDQCVLVMPARRCQAGQTAVRLGRVVA
jgi:predicted deacylase